MKKVILFVSLFIVLLVVGGAAWAYFAFLYTKPLNKAELAELTPDWSVVTHGNWSPWYTEADGSQTWNPAASFNAWLATVPEEDKAWPIFVDVQFAGTELYKSMDAGSFPEDVEDWAQMVAMCELEESGAMIEQVKIALQKPVMGASLYEMAFPYDDMVYTNDPIEFAAMEKHEFEKRAFVLSTNPNLDILTAGLPALGLHRGFVNIARTYAIFEFQRGDVDAFIELTELSMDSAELAVELPTLISQLVAMAIESHGNQTIAWALEHHSEQLTDEHLLELDQLIARHQNRTFLWEGEAIGFHDTIRRTVDDRGALKMTGARTLQGGGGSFDIPTSLPDAQLHASAQRTLYAYNKMLTQVQVESSIPLVTNGLSAMQIFESEKKKLNSTGSLFLGLLTPALDKSAERFRRLQQESFDLRYLIASHRHALRHGEMPASNEDIDDDLMPD